MQDGMLAIPIDGRWKLDDLDDFAESFRISYVYYYIVDEKTEKDDDRVRLVLAKYFWSGSYEGSDFADKLYHVVPDSGRPYVKRFQYASPGIVEITAALGALYLLSRCVKIWIENAHASFDLYKKIDDFFYKKNLRKIPKTFNLDHLSPKDIDDARTLCFDFGKWIGLEEVRVERIINLTGNPISALKLLAQMAREGERLGRLERGGKAQMTKARLLRADSTTESATDS